MKNIVFINASPKLHDQSASKYLVDMVADHIGTSEANKTVINIRRSITRRQTREDFEKMTAADAIIIACPLYVFCLPGIVMRFLQDYYEYYIEQGRPAGETKMYAVFNCGFPEPEINLEAVRVVKSFCQHVNFQFRFGILIGGGAMLLETKDAPFMKKTIRNLNNAFAAIARDIESNDLKEMDNIHVAMNFPRRLYLFMGDRGWVSLARKNGLKKKELYRRPYQEKRVPADI